MKCTRVDFALGGAWTEWKKEKKRHRERKRKREISQKLPLSNVAGYNQKMTTTHGGHVYYVIKVPKESDGNER